MEGERTGRWVAAPTGRCVRSEAMAEPVQIAVTGAAGQIGYSLLFRLASGALLGPDQPVVLMDAIRLVERLTGQTALVENRPAHPADVTATWADVSRARQVLAWEPRVSVAAGVTSLVDWYQAERAWASQIETGR